MRNDPSRNPRNHSPLVVLVKKKGTTSGLRSANLQSGGYGGWRPRLSSFAGRRRQVRGRWGAGCLKSLAPEEHFSRFPAARLRGRAVPCAARCGAAAMRSSFRLFVPPNGYFFFQNNTGGGWSQLGGMCGCTTYREGEKPREDGTVTSEERHRKDTLTQVRVH